MQDTKIQEMNSQERTKLSERGQNTEAPNSRRVKRINEKKM